MPKRQPQPWKEQPCDNCGAIVKYKQGSVVGKKRRFCKITPENNCYINWLKGNPNMSSFNNFQHSRNIIEDKNSRLTEDYLQ